MNLSTWKQRHMFNEQTEEERKEWIRQQNEYRGWLKRQRVNAKVRILNGKEGLIKRIKEVHQRMKSEKATES